MCIRDRYISNYVYLLEEGICALNSITKQGEEKVYLYFRPNRLIGFNQFVVSAEKLNASTPEFSVVTKTTCTLCQIPYSAFQELIVKNPEFNAFFIETLADNYNDALIHFHLMPVSYTHLDVYKRQLQMYGEKNSAPLSLPYCHTCSMVISSVLIL